MSSAVLSKQEKLEQLRKIALKEKKIKELKAQAEAHLKNCSIRYYCVRPDLSYVGPHKGQTTFHASKKRIRIASGGNRSGKSTCGAAESTAFALGFRPWLEKDDPNYKVDVRVPNKGLICGESFGEQVKKVLVAKLLGDVEKGVPGAIPTAYLRGTKKNPQGIVTEIYLNNGSSMYLQSYDQPVELFESADYDWFWADEPPPRAIWVAVQRGLTDRGGRSWITMTPLKEPWLFDELYSREDVDVFYFDIEDNLNFGLSRENIDSFTMNLTEDEREARLRGKYFHLTGLVYKSYKNVHRVKRFPIPKHWNIWMHIDTHPRTPHHALYLAARPDGTKFVCGEYKNKDSNNKIEPFCDALKTYEKTMFGRRVDEFVRLIEPGSKVNDPIRDGYSIWDEFAKFGFVCKPGSKNRDSGILLLQDSLRYEPDKGVYPTIFFFSDLEGIHHEMTHYIWDEWANKSGQNKNEKQVPKDKDDHFIEGLHRILLDEPYTDRGSEVEEPEYRKETLNKITGY